MRTNKQHLLEIIRRGLLKRKEELDTYLTDDLEGQKLSNSWVGIAELILEGYPKLEEELKGNTIKEKVENLAQGLRRFVKGESKKDGTRHYKEPGKTRLEGIIIFLQDRSYSDFCIPESLFEEKDINTEIRNQASFFLLQYLNQTRGERCRIEPVQINGQYIANHLIQGDYYDFKLEIKMSKSDKAIEVSLLEEKQQQKEALWKYAGWGVCLPDDSIVVFLQNTKDNTNRVFISVEVDDVIYDNDTNNRLIGYLVLCEQTPQEYGSSSNINALIFKRKIQVD